MENDNGQSPSLGGRVMGAITSLFGAGGAPDGKMVERAPKEDDKATVELIKKWSDSVIEAHDYWKERAFDPMKQAAKFVSGAQWPDQKPARMEPGQKYVANIALRHVKQRVASIYAKNPRVRAQRRPRLYGRAWDGSQEMLMAAMQSPQDPMAAEVLAEAKEAQTQRALYDRMGKTLEIVAHYQMDEQKPRFKTSMKRLVARALISKVGFVKVGYQRIMKPVSPDWDSRLRGMTDRLAVIEQQLADMHDGETQEGTAEAAELRANIEALQKEKNVVDREGLTFSFPKSWQIIVSKSCTQLYGFVGAHWVAQEYYLSRQEVQRIYKMDVGKSFTPYTDSGGNGRAEDGKGLVRVLEIYDLIGQKCMTLAVGCDRWLREPGPPDVEMEQFHPYFALIFNEGEAPEDGEAMNIYPLSDVELLRPMAEEINRSREALRQHRIANRPAYIGTSGVFNDESKDKLGSHADHEFIETNLPKGEDVRKAIQAKPVTPIEASLYEVESFFGDFQRTLGDQEANMGGTSGATATEVSVAENSRVGGLQSQIDDLDEFLTDLWKAAGQVLLLNMQKPMVEKIAGPGAVWPELSKQDVADELYLDLRAGSSGRPNKQARLMAIEKTMPMLLQMPRIKPEKLAELTLQEIDETLEVEDFYGDEGMPSIVAQNAMASRGGAAGVNLSPQAGGAAQAAAGAVNAGAPPEATGGGRNMMPAPSVTQ